MSKRYGLPSGNQLAVAIVGPPSATASGGRRNPYEPEARGAVEATRA